MTPAAAVAAALLLGASVAGEARAGGRFRVDPARSTLRFSLGATLHTVHGEAKLVGGELRFEPAGGAVRGEVVVDARSFVTGNATRDRSMHEDVLASERFPEIRFVAERLDVERRGTHEAEVTLHGRVGIHGGEHALAVPARVARDGDELRVRARFDVPYVAWGLRDVSTFVLRVAKHVEVQLDLRGALELPAAPGASAGPEAPDAPAAPEAPESRAAP